MLRFPHGIIIVIALFTAAILLGALAGMNAQQPTTTDETARAIALYQRGQLDEAIQLLSDQY